MIEGDEILLLDEVHLGFAVSLPGGLAAPVVRDVDARPLSEIARDVRDLAERARAGTLRPAGRARRHGDDHQPRRLRRRRLYADAQSAADRSSLASAGSPERPVVDAGLLAIGSTCVLSLTFDHRVADGAPAAELLAAVARSA